ncbi:MAG TPA: hypothetical protein VEX36_06045 [Thermoleophilaceae bacterium]|nr:hypothetical protein [Thermoleophilaceae bacterium]
MQEPEPSAAAGISSEESVGPVRIFMRSYFSTNFLWTALHTSRLVSELESAEGDRPHFDMAHRSYAASSVIASATFLEAVVSELFQDALDGHALDGDGYLEPLRVEAVSAMAKVWRATSNGRSLDALEKWQWLLECCDRERLDRGAAPAQDAGLVIRLRNALVHFKPENVAADEEHELEKSLKGRFPDNYLMEGSGNPWWPSHGLGHGCSAWAVSSSRALADHVLAEVGIEPNYSRIETAGWNGLAP